MKKSNLWVLLICTGLVASTACSKKSDDSSSAAPAAGSGGTTAQPTTPSPSPVMNASLKENADGTASLELTLPDANGVNTSHKGIIDRSRETELRSDDGKSLVAIRALEGFGILVAVQYQADRSDGRLYILTKNQADGYEPILARLPSERNGGLAKAISAITDIGQSCHFTVTESVATLAQYFRMNTAANLDQYSQDKQKELKETQKCVAADLSTDPKGKVQITWGAKKAPAPDSPDSNTSPAPVPTVPKENPAQPEPIPEQMPDLPLPLPKPSKQVIAPAPAPAPAPAAPTPPVVSQPPASSAGTAPILVTDQNGYHQNWQVCYASGYWRTDGNSRCKQTWWPNCSPDTGGKVCKVRVDDEGRHQPVPNPAPNSSPKEIKGSWTQDFNVCYQAGKWQTDGNYNCKKDYWPNCSPDTGGNRCRPVYRN